MLVTDIALLNEVLPAGSSLQGGNFIIEAPLGVGAFGITYLARDRILNRPVVIKEYFPEGCRRSGEEVIPYQVQNTETFVQAREHFLQEARILAQFHHRGIVGVHNFFEANNTAYMVMEYLEGPTLLEVQVERGFLEPSEVINIARQICDALKVVHDAGMLHRDIKPNNIIWCTDGRVVLVDFGLSERFDDSSSRHTRPLDTALRFGTPGFAPLEQYTHSAQLGPPSDIYALGATLYQLCCGTTPLPSTDRACGIELESPKSTHPVLSECIMWAMSQEIKKRPASVGIFLKRINEADAILLARHQIVDIIQKQSIQKEKADLAAFLKVTEEAVPVDDGGCMKVVFILYMSLWCFIALVAFIFLFVRYVLVGG